MDADIQVWVGRGGARQGKARHGRQGVAWRGKACVPLLGLLKVWWWQGEELRP